MSKGPWVHGPLTLSANALIYSTKIHLRRTEKWTRLEPYPRVDPFEPEDAAQGQVPKTSRIDPRSIPDA